jgi:hypothetical protein
MSTDDYRRALEAAIKEYETLGEERQRIDKRLSELAHTISTLSRLLGFTPTVSWGLTDACRVVLRNAGKPMTPTEVRDRLRAIGFDLSKYTSELTAVHTTLKRLNEAGELRFVAGALGRRAYIWERPARAAGFGPEIAQIAREMTTRAKPPRRKP